jgi:hypothetical protein
MPKYLTNTTFFNDALGTYIANGIVQTKKVVLNGDIVLTGSLINGDNTISFDEETTNILKDIHIYGAGYIDFNNASYNIGELLAQYVAGSGIPAYPSISYDEDTQTTTFLYNLVFPNNSIDSSAINNADLFVKTATNQDITGEKSFSGTQLFSSIQLNSDLIVNSGGTTITNAQLQLIPNISTIQTDLNNVKTKTTNISFSGSTTTITGSITVPTNSISRSAVNGGAVDIITNQTLSGQKTMSSLFTCTDNIRLDGSLILNTNTLTIPNSTLQKLQFISTISSDIQTQTTNNSTNITTNTNNITTNTNNITTNTNSINSINTKLTDVSYATANTTISNTLNLTNLNFTGTLNNFSKLDVNNVFTQCASLGSNCQNQINDAINKASSAQNKADSADEKAVNAQNTATSALTLAGIANGTAGTALGLAGTAQTTATGAVSVNTTQQTEIDDLQADVITLQAKTSQITYSPTTLRTSIGQTTYILQAEIGELISGINQTTQDQITFAGLLRCNNRVEINNTLELINNNSIIVEGIINQDNSNPPNSGVNQFQAPTNFNGNCIFTNSSTTINATTTQIGVNAVSTLNCNATAIFGGDITMGSTKNLTLKNIVPILLNDIYFGGEAGVYLNDDVVFNMKIEANRPVQINNTFQVGTTINRNTFNSYTTTTVLDANTGMTLTTPTIGITSPLVSIGQGDATSITLNSSGVYIGQLLGSNYLYGTTYVQNLYSASGILGMAGQVFQQF